MSERQSMVGGWRSLGRIVAGRFAEGLLLLLSLATGAHLGVGHSNLFLVGLTFIPPIWLTTLSYLAAGGLLLARRPRFSCGLVIGGCLFFVAFGDYSLSRRGTRSESAAHKSDFQVLAMNVQFYAQGVSQVMGAIRELAPDVALLSENTLSRSEAQAFAVAPAGYHFLAGSGEGPAILARHPVLHWQAVNFPSHHASLSSGNQLAQQHLQARRRFIHATLAVHGRPVHVLSVRFIAGRAGSDHALDQLLWGRYLLRQQSAEVAFFARYVEQLEGPVVFGGDLNAPPAAPTIRRLRAAWHDAYLDHHVWGGFTFRTRTPSFIRLDYLFYGGPLVSVAAQVPDVRVADHYPVMGTFRFADGLAGTHHVSTAPPPG